MKPTSIAEKAMRLKIVVFIFFIFVKLENSFREDVPEFEVECPSCQRLAELVPNLFVHQVVAFQGYGIFAFVGQQ